MSRKGQARYIAGMSAGRRHQLETLLGLVVMALLIDRVTKEDVVAPRSSTREQSMCGDQRYARRYLQNRRAHRARRPLGKSQSKAGAAVSGTVSHEGARELARTARERETSRWIENVQQVPLRADRMSWSPCGAPRTSGSERRLLTLPDAVVTSGHCTDRSVSGMVVMLVRRAFEGRCPTGPPAPWLAI
jgi:hypothetical protein